MKEEIELKVECKICGKKFKNLSSLSRHIFQAHKVKIEEYYLQFIGKQGKCLNCGKDTKYLDINNGYRDFCSCRCSTLYEGTKEKTKKTNLKKHAMKNMIVIIQCNIKNLRKNVNKHVLKIMEFIFLLKNQNL